MTQKEVEKALRLEVAAMLGDMASQRGQGVRTGVLQVHLSPMLVTRALKNLRDELRGQ